MKLKWKVKGGEDVEVSFPTLALFVHPIAVFRLARMASYHAKAMAGLSLEEREARSLQMATEMMENPQGWNVREIRHKGRRY